MTRGGSSLKKKIQNQSDLKGESVHRHYAILSRRST